MEALVEFWNRPPSPHCEGLLAVKIEICPHIFLVKKLNYNVMLRFLNATVFKSFFPYKIYPKLPDLNAVQLIILFSLPAKMRQSDLFIQKSY